MTFASERPSMPLESIAKPKATANSTIATASRRLRSTKSTTNATGKIQTQKCALLLCGDSNSIPHAKAPTSPMPTRLWICARTSLPAMPGGTERSARQLPRTPSEITASTAIDPAKVTYLVA